MYKNILEITKNVLDSCGVGYDEDGYIYPTKENKKKLALSGLELTLPMRKHTDSLSKLVNGELKNIKIIFNPITQLVAIDNSSSVAALKNMMTLRLATTIFNMLLLTLKGYSRNDTNDLTLLDLYKKFREGVNSSVKNIGDEKMVKNFLNLCQENMKDIVHFHLKKDRTIEERKYKYVLYIDFPLFQRALDGEKLFKRNLDNHIFKTMISHYFSDLMENPVIGKSNHKTFARFIALLDGYENVAIKLNEELLKMTYIDESIVDNNIIKIAYDKQYIAESTDEINAEIEKLPADTQQESLVSKSDSFNTSSALENSLNTVGAMGPRDPFGAQPQPNVEVPLQQVQPQINTQIQPVQSQPQANTIPVLLDMYNKPVNLQTLYLYNNQIITNPMTNERFVVQGGKLIPQQILQQQVQQQVQSYGQVPQSVYSQTQSTLDPFGGQTSVYGTEETSDPRFRNGPPSLINFK